jgi:uncharacterized damage-inducible protein DinB
MIDKDWVCLMARYNRWQNRSLYSAAGTLDDAARREDRGAFFGSIHATLNHIYWGDRIWMSRLAGWDKPEGGLADSVNSIADWDVLVEARESFDEALLDWAEKLDDAALEGNLAWHSAATQRDWSTPRWICITHLFNHQTHHRGQVHAMLTDAGAKPGATDIPFMP